MLMQSQFCVLFSLAFCWTGVICDLAKPQTASRFRKKVQKLCSKLQLRAAFETLKPKINPTYPHRWPCEVVVFGNSFDRRENK